MKYESEINQSNQTLGQRASRALGIRKTRKTPPSQAVPLLLMGAENRQNRDGTAWDSPFMALAKLAKPAVTALF